MDATLNIIVRVAAKQAQAQLAATAKAVQNVQSASRFGSANKALKGYLGNLRKVAMAQANFATNLANSQLINHGKNINWVGRQLTYNFTLPLVLAGGALFKFNQNIERSMVQVRKVYGDLSFSSKRIKEETDALSKSFELLSSRFGVAQDSVIDIGAAFASAGSAGRGLAENTKAALELMILGEMESVEATEALIAIQAQWRLSTFEASGETSELTKTLAILNIVENETAATMEDLVVSMSRSSGVARSAGVTIRELAAMTAALVPAAGNATEAGNSLKTIISRMMAPTRQMTDVLRAMGIVPESADWLGSTATEKLQMIADGFGELTTAQQAYASSILAGRRQVSRFSILMAEMANDQGFYQKALDASSDEARNLAQYQKELNTVLDSNPRKWDIMTNTIKNTMASAFIPLMPAIMGVVSAITQLAQAFSKLDPKTQRLILFGFVAVAVLGPLMSLVGTTMQLIGVMVQFGRVIAGLFTFMVWLGKGLWVMVGAFQTVVTWVYSAINALVTFAPIAWTAFRQVLWIVGWVAGAIAGALGIPLWALVAIIAAVAAAIVLILKTDIEDPFVRAMQNIAKTLGRLPSVIAQIFTNVVQVIRRAMEIVVEYLSYLNPFQRHSPSLVDNVRAGISVILSEYEKLKTIPATVARALASLSAFRMSSSTDVTGFRSTELQSQVSQVAAVNPVAGADAQDMVDSIMELEAVLPGLSAEIAAQSIKVARLTHEYDQADAAFEAANDSLGAIQDQMSAVSKEMDEAQNKLNDLANMKITGMTEMEDAIFANSMAQKQLNLELLQYEKAGYSIDGVRDKMAALAGDIEMLRGEQMDLRNKGAGSDVLGVYEEEIKALEEQKGPLSDIADQIGSIQDELDALDIEGQILELTKSITFDPLLREIDKLVHGVEEMDFADIIAGISEQQEIIKGLQETYDDLAAAEEAAKKTVDDTKAARDAIGGQLDEEQGKLDGLEESYAAIEALIREMENAMSSYLTAAKAAAEATKAAASTGGADQSLFDAAAAGDFEIEGGDAVLGAEGDVFDIEAFNKEMDEMLQEALEGMGDFDIMSIFSDLWAKVTGWWTGLGNWISDVGNWLVGIPSGIGNWVQTNIIDPIANFLAPIGTWMNDWVITPIIEVFGAVTQPIMDVISVLGEGISGAWNTFVQPVIDFIAGTFGVVWESIRTNVGVVLEIVGAQLEVFGTIWDVVWGLIGGYVRASWDIIKSIWEGIYGFIEDYLIFGVQTLQVVFEIAWKLITLAVQAAWDILKWIWEALVDKIQWVGSIITAWKDGAIDAWNMVATAVSDLYDKYVEPNVSAIGTIFQTVWDGIKGLFEGSKELFAPVGNALKDLYNNVIKPTLNAIGSVFASVWNGVMSATETALNFFVSMFNLIAGGINAVASLLGIDSRITPLGEVSFARVSFNMDTSDADRAVNGPVHGSGGGGNVRYMESGGILGKMGGVTKDIRAIVGEGSDVHPEYVIPTDPAFRDRAKGLYNQLGQSLGMGDDGYSHMDLFGDIGGAISSGFNTAKNAVGSVAGFMKDKAVAALWTPVRALGKAALNLIPDGWLKTIGSSVFDSVDGWVTGAGNAWDEESQRRVPAGFSAPGGWRAILAMLSQSNIPYKFLSGYRPGAITRNTGKPSWHGKDRAVDLGSASGSFPSSYSPAQLLRINHAIYDAYKPMLQEMIYGGPGAKNVFRGRDHRFSPALMREHINHVHAAMARGGFVVPRSPGGSLLRVGEGLHDEAVQVTPLHGQDSTNNNEGTVNNFYGELVFPNIKTGNDAEELIRNLEVLSK